MTRIRRSKEMRDVIPILMQNGYSYARAKGSHFIYVNKQTGKHLTINKNLNREVKARLLKEMEVNANE